MPYSSPSQRTHPLKSNRQENSRRSRSWCALDYSNRSDIRTTHSSIDLEDERVLIEQECMLLPQDTSERQGESRWSLRAVPMPATPSNCRDRLPYRRSGGNQHAAPHYPPSRTKTGARESLTRHLPGVLCRRFVA